MPPKKPGRPALPQAWKRVQTSTTIPLDLAEAVRERRYKINELIQDGFFHRTRCAAQLRKMEVANAALQERIDALTKED